MTPLNRCFKNKRAFFKRCLRLNFYIFIGKFLLDNLNNIFLSFVVVDGE